MQVADSQWTALSEVNNKDRIVPIMTTVAVHVLIVYGIAMSAGVVPSFIPERPFTVVDLPPVTPTQPTVAEPPLATPFIVPSPIDPLEVPVVPVDVGLPTFTEGEGIHIRDTGEGTVAKQVLPVTGVRLLKSSEPPYPMMSRIRDEAGVVLVRVAITPFGTVGDVQVEKSSGFTRLDEAALKAVREWRFAPAKRGNEAISGSVLVPVRFELHR